MKKKARKTPANRTASFRPSTSSAIELSPPEEAPEQTGLPGPGFILAILSPDKAARIYQAHESVFLQGDAADAVFYIESGKVKLTVVSKNGKEAVVAILPADSFFGEGCLAGQPLRMGSASAEQTSTVI